MQANIALIELGGSHDECLYSQVLFLKKYGYKVFIILFKDHLNRIEAWSEVDEWFTFEKPKGFLSGWGLIFKIRRCLRRHDIEQAVINTAEGNIIRKLSMLSGRKMKYTGLVHLSRKLWTSNSQKIISRKIRKYFVLADFIRENLLRKAPSLALEYFYPVYFPEQVQSPGSTKDFMVCIPGAVDFARRDYHSLMDEIIDSGVPDGMRFILLGRTTGADGKILLERIRREGLEKHFIIFEGFIEHRIFYEYLGMSDLILPLITPGSLDHDDYLKYKITGTYNLAWGFKIPMLMHETFNNYQIFRRTSIFHKSGEIINTLKSLDPGRIKDLGKEIAELEDFDFNLQAERYVSFIKG